MRIYIFNDILVMLFENVSLCVETFTIYTIERKGYPFLFSTYVEKIISGCYSEKYAVIA